MPFVQTHDHTSLFYRDWGDGKPVLFVSSWALSSDMWQYQTISLISQGLRCIAYDRRGHGRSDDPGRGYDYDTLADDLAALIEHLDLHDVTLVAHSMAGGEVVRYLTRHGSERVAGIVLLAATLPFPMKTADNPDGLDTRVAEGIRASWTEDFTRWIEANRAPFFGEGLPGCDVSVGIQQWLIRDLQHASLQALIECNRAMVETDFRAELRAIEVPTLIIHGDSDAGAPVELTGCKSAQLAPGSRLVVYENGPHGLFVTHRERLNADLFAFVTRDAASARLGRLAPR
jgi:pimeloyl-ACP methyl ester carboxylesterase